MIVLVLATLWMGRAAAPTNVVMNELARNLERDNVMKQQRLASEITTALRDGHHTLESELSMRLAAAASLVGVAGEAGEDSVVTDRPDLESTLCLQVRNVIFDSGRDLPSRYQGSVPTADACCEACAQEGRCGSWTFKAAGGMCFLKRRRSWLRHAGESELDAPHLEDLRRAKWSEGRTSGRVAVRSAARSASGHAHAATRARARLSLTTASHRGGARFTLDDLRFLDDGELLTAGETLAQESDASAAAKLEQTLRKKWHIRGGMLMSNTAVLEDIRFEDYVTY